jgi:hypothetical protein
VGMPTFYKEKKSTMQHTFRFSTLSMTGLKKQVMKKNLPADLCTTKSSLFKDDSELSYWYFSRLHSYIWAVKMGNFKLLKNFDISFFFLSEYTLQKIRER